MIELVVVIAIIALVVTVLSAGLSSFRKEIELTGAASEIVSVFKEARARTLASESESQFGVHIDDIDSELVLFKGADYASREVGVDEEFSLSNLVEVSSIDLGGSEDVVFELISGKADVSGSFTIRLKSNTSRTKTIIIQPTGLVYVQ